MGAVQANVRWWLRLDGLAISLAAIAAYQHFGFDWWTFLIWFMAPDLSMIAYARGPRIGAMAYNATHSYAGPAMLLLAAMLTQAFTYQAALIWLAHFGLCRAAGFGLKYVHSFDATHLGTAPFNLPEFILGLIRRRA